MRNKGFTLIELLIVIAIIGLLASVVMVSLTAARSKGRDAKRLADLKQIQTALEMYYNDNNSYPTWVTTAWGIDCSGFRGSAGSGNTFLKPLVDGGYLATYPNDPDTSANCKIQYRSEKPADGTSPAQGYRIVVHMENIPNTNLSCYPTAYWYCVSINYP